jgi:hypothetical protein
MTRLKIAGSTGPDVNSEFASAKELMDAYLEYMEDTESPLLYHRWSFISGLAALLERNIHFPFGPQTIYPNLYVILLGPPASRKSTSINALADLLGTTGFRKFAGDKSHKDKFIEDLFEGFDTMESRLKMGGKKGATPFEIIGDDFLDLDADEMSLAGSSGGGASRQKPGHISAVYIKASEMQNFMGIHNNDFISWLTDIYDNPPLYNHRLKAAESSIVYGPTVNILGGATSASLQSIFNHHNFEQGILSRFLLVHGEGRRKKIAFPKQLDKAKGDVLRDHLIKVLNLVSGKVTMEPDAVKLSEKIYSDWIEIPDVRFAYYGGRRFSILIKLGMVFAAMRISTRIEARDILLANTLLCYTESLMPKALGEFGKSTDGQFVQDIHNTIQAHPHGINLEKLREAMLNTTTNISKTLEAVEQLYALTRIDKISRKEHDAYGLEKSVMYLVPVSRESIKTQPHVDYKLLAEYVGHNTGE